MLLYRVDSEACHSTLFSMKTPSCALSSMSRMGWLDSEASPKKHQ